MPFNKETKKPLEIVDEVKPVIKISTLISIKTFDIKQTLTTLNYFSWPDTNITN